MYKDNSDSDYEEKNTEESYVMRKSLSTIGFRYSPENQCARPMSLRPTQSLTGTLEEYRLCNNLQRLGICNRDVPRSKCPCGCFLRPTITCPFRTREKSTLALYVFTPDILSFHGCNYDPNQIALLWKKDCRTFLWKGKSKRREKSPT